METPISFIRGPKTYIYLNIFISFIFQLQYFLYTVYEALKIDKRSYW
jgi:hypothetical protein